MSSVEKLFVQIFERKKWIEEQVQQQSDLFDQYLASTCLIQGIRPPSWLLSSGFEGGSADLKELKKEELISGLLFPPWKPNILSKIGRTILYRRPVISEDSAQQSQGFITETCASNKYFDVGDRLTQVSKFNIKNTECELGGSLQSVPKLDHNITSPRDPADARKSDARFELDGSLVKIQRSRSRQKALELRYSEKLKSTKRPHEDWTTESHGRITRSRTSGHIHAKASIEVPNFSTSTNRTGGRVTSSRFFAQKHNSVDKSLQSLNGISREDHKKGTAVDKRHLATNCDEGLIEPNSSSILPSDEVARSRNTSSNKPSQLPSPSNQVEGHDLLRASDAQLNTVPINDGSGISLQEKCNKVTAENEGVSDLPVEAPSYHSGSNKKAGSRGIVRGVLAPSPLPEINTYVEPKKLLFDEVEDCNLNVHSSPAAKGEIGNGLPEMRTMLLEPKETVTKVTATGPQSLEKNQDLKSVSIEENCKASSDACYSSRHSVRTEESDRTSHPACTGEYSPSMQSREESKTHGHILVNTPGNNLIPNQVLVESSRKLVGSSGTNEGRHNCVRTNKSDKTSHPARTGETLPAVEFKEESQVRERIMADTPGSKMILHQVLESSRKLIGSSDTHEGRRNSNSTEKSDEAFHPECTGETSFAMQSTELLGHILADTPGSNEIPKQMLVESRNLVGSDAMQEQSGLAVDPEFLEGDQSIELENSQEEQRACLKAFDEKHESVKEEKSHSHPKVSTRKTLNASPPPSRKETSEIYNKGSARSSKQVMGLPNNNLNASPVARRSSLVQLEGELDRCLSDLDMEPQKVGFGEVCIPRLDVIPDKMSVEEHKLNVDGYSSPLNSMIPDPVTESSLVKNHDISDEEEENKYVVATDTGLSVQLQSMIPRSEQINTTVQEARYFLRSHTSLGNNDNYSRLNGSCLANESMQLTKAMHGTVENSWPPYKRRKLEGRSSELSSTFPNLGRAKTLDHNDDNLRHVKDGSRSDLQFRHFSASFDVEVAHSDLAKRPSAEMYQSEKRRKTEKYESSSDLQAKPGGLGIEREDQHTSNSFQFEESGVDAVLIPSAVKEANVSSKNCSKDKVGLKDLSALKVFSEDHHNLQSPKIEMNMGRMKEWVSAEDALQEKQCDIGELSFPYCSVQATDEDIDPNVADQTMPEFEGFSMGVPTDGMLSSVAEGSITLDKFDLPRTQSEHVRFLERLCRSTGVLTPLPQSSKCKILETPDIYKSLPNGLLESMGLENPALLNGYEIKQQPKPIYNFMGAEDKHSSYSDEMASTSVKFDWGVQKLPSTPPIRSGCQRVTSISSVRSSGKYQSTNPELTCFRIDEGSSTSEGNADLDEVVDVVNGDSDEVDVVQERFSPRDHDSSIKRGPLVELTNINPSATVSVTQTLYDRGSLASVNTEVDFPGTQKVAKQNTRNGYATNRTSKYGDKENRGSSIGGNGVGKSSDSRYNRFSRPKKAPKASEKKGSKSSNIVTSVSSFIPLVQQKRQQAAVATGKRDIKVKALEAAENAKRVEEKRENDRKMKKEAAKLERARLEQEKQEKIKQLELKQKMKEEERKRKEVEMASKKRLREEEERKEKEKKRKCAEEAHKQQKEERLRTVKENKEQRYRVVDETECKRKELQNEEKKQQKALGMDIAECRKMTELCVKPADVSAGNTNKACSDREVSEALKGSPQKVEGSLYRISDYGFSFTGGSGEQSYEMSPYLASDDDDDEEEEEALSNKKFLPSWARETHLASVIPSMQQIDPVRIFPRETFCSAAEGRQFSAHPMRGRQFSAHPDIFVNRKEVPCHFVGYLQNPDVPVNQPT